MGYRRLEGGGDLVNIRGVFSNVELLEEVDDNESELVSTC